MSIFTYKISERIGSKVEIPLALRPELSKETNSSGSQKHVLKISRVSFSFSPLCCVLFFFFLMYVYCVSILLSPINGQNVDTTCDKDNNPFIESSVDFFLNSNISNCGSRKEDVVESRIQQIETFPIKIRFESFPCVQF